MNRLKCFFVGVLAIIVSENAYAFPDDNEAFVVKPPLPEYPYEALASGITGNCTVTIDILDYGKTITIPQVTCTHTAFCEEAARSAKEMQFKILDVPGTTTPGKKGNYKYPLSFTIDGEPETPSDAPQKPCLPSEGELIS